MNLILLFIIDYELSHLFQNIIHKQLLPLPSDTLY